MSFLPLHIYSGYSFLKSGLSLSKIVALGAKAGYEYIGLSDDLSLTGFPELYHLCTKNGLKPLFGMDLKVNHQRFTLYIQNEIGYRNLIQLGHLASKQEVDEAFFFNHVDGLFVILNSDYSLLYEHQQDDVEYCATLLQPYSKRIPNLLISVPYLPHNPYFVAFIRNFVSKYPYPTIAFPHILYQKKEDAIALMIVEAIARNEHLEQKEASGDQYYLSKEELTSFYSQEELDACGELANQVDFNFMQKRGTLLVYPNDSGLSNKDYLRKLALDGLTERKPDYDQRYIDRLNYELSIIESMGYVDYFLVVKDYVDYARSVGISVGPSRGSGACSLVAYALHIVLLDPIKYDLMFERFLNPKRASMPDIDVDFSDIRRGEVVTYLQQKYGKSRVSQIVTMQTLGARASIHDIGRIYGYADREIKMILDTMPFENQSLGYNYKNSPEFKALLDSDPYYLQIVSLAHKIEGLPRQAGLHAAGVILNNQALEEAIPVFENEDGSLVCQYEMTYLEEQGFLKMDILALSNLTTIERCIELVKLRTGKQINYAKIPFEDKNAISLISAGLVMGLFQLESPGMQRAIAQIRPETFEDVAAVLALFRPGPMEFIPSFASRKHGKERYHCITPALEPILNPTYGIIVYQEQILQIVRVMAGFDFGQADLFRRAISKKDPAKLASLKQGFAEGCRKNGYSEQIIEQVFAFIDKFANYGFAKAHAYGYAVVTCQMATLKYYYPLEFYCAILEGRSPGNVSFSQIYRELKRQRISLYLPDINESLLSYMPSKGRGIRLPLTVVKGVQSRFLQNVIEERIQNGPYQDLFDFAIRTKQYGLKLEWLIALIDGGAFDSIYPHRASLRLSASSAISYAETFVGEGGDSLLLNLNFPKPSMKNIQDTPSVDLEAERESIGIMLSGSPLREKEAIIKSKKLLPISAVFESKYNVRIAACVRAFKQITTKKGNKFAVLTIFDDSDEIEVTLFKEHVLEAFPLAKPGNLIEITVRNDRIRQDSFIGSDIKPL